MSADLPNPPGIAGAVLILIASLGVTAVVSSFGDYEHYDNDTAQAVIGARYIANGEGYLTDSLYYQEHYIPETIPAPQTVFPPGSSILIAALTRLSIAPTDAMSVISFVSFALIPICVYLLALKAGVRPSVATVIGLLWIAVVTAWENAYRLRSDVTFLMLSVISTWFLARPVRRPVAFAFLAGCAAAMGLLMRYAGLFFMTAAALSIAFDWARLRTKAEFKELVAFCIPTGITVLILFVRNYQAVGDVKGGNNFVADKAVSVSLYELYQMWVTLTGLGHANLFDWNPVEYVAACALLLLVATVWMHRSSIRLDRTLLQSVVDRRVLTICMIYPLLTVALLIWLEFTSCCGMRARMFMVLVPFVFVLIAVLPQITTTGSGAGKFRVVGVLLVATFLLGQVEAAKTALLEWPSLNTVKTACESQVDPSTKLLDFLRERISHEHPLIVNEPQITGAYIQRPVVGMADWRYTDTVWEEDAVKQHVQRYDVEWVLVFVDESLRSDWVPFLAELADGKSVEWLELHSANDKHRLYRVVD